LPESFVVVKLCCWQGLLPESFVGRGFSRDIKTIERLGFSPWRIKQDGSTLVNEIEF
jgi:hypothetical protein